MAIKDTLKRIVYRIGKVRLQSKKTLEDRELQEACNKEALAFEAWELQEARKKDALAVDKVQSSLIGLGMKGASNSHESSEEIVDPRFVTPIGIGTSRSFEDSRSSGPTGIPGMESSIPDPAGLRASSVENDDAMYCGRHSTFVPSHSVSDCGVYTGPYTHRVDWAQGKRKRRAAEADNEDVGTTRDWLTYMERENLIPHHKETRRLIAVLKGRAWTF